MWGKLEGQAEGSNYKELNIHGSAVSMCAVMQFTP